MNLKPRRIRGVWTDGYVLDVHTTGSTFLGHDEYGHPVFDTKRSDAGELLYRLKYRSDSTALSEIGDVAEGFLREWGIQFDGVIAVPPTRNRKIQPVLQITDEIARRFSVPVLRTAVRKVRDTAELKNIHDFDERLQALEGAFAAKERDVSGRSILLVDDLVRSGATMGAVAGAILTAGAEAVYAFALTKTRTA
jgi:competence protein ComFC